MLLFQATMSKTMYISQVFSWKKLRKQVCQTYFLKIVKFSIFASLCDALDNAKLVSCKSLPGSQLGGRADFVKQAIDLKDPDNLNSLFCFAPEIFIKK